MSTKMGDKNAQQEEQNKRARHSACRWLLEHKVGELVRNQRRLVEIPYTATLAHTVNALVANDVVAVPVAAPPGHWIGAGGSLIVESDRATGAVRKHYIGMVTMLDVLAHIGEDDAQQEGFQGLDLEKKMAVPVSSVIGHSLEGLSLWTLNPNTSILDCMESFSKGVHRALVPLESHTDNVIAVDIVESSPGYRMLTQMDVLRFLKAHDNELKDIISRSVGDLGAITDSVLAVTKFTKVIEAIKSMRSFSLAAVPIVEAFEAPEDGQRLQDGKGAKVIGTFSTTDLRGCPMDLLKSWLFVNVMEFTERVAIRTSNIDNNTTTKKLITCYPESSLAEVIEAAVVGRVHRVWVVDQHGLLMGLVSLIDMLRVLRDVALHADQEVHESLGMAL